MQVVYLPADQKHALLYPLTKLIPTYFCANWLTHLILMPEQNKKVIENTAVLLMWKHIIIPNYWSLSFNYI